MTKEVQDCNPRQRCYYIDWMRIIAIIAIFFVHDMRFFDSIDHQLKNTETSLLLTVVVLYCYFWLMPALFMLAGASSKLSLLVRTKKQYVYERYKRLFLPLVFGIIVLVPPQRYVEYLSKGSFSGTYPEFISWYFGHLWTLGDFGFDPQWFSYLGTHLWFLGVLLIFSVAGLPLFACMESDRGHKIMTKCAVVAKKTGGILLFAIPLMLIRIVLQPVFSAYVSWCDLAFWFIAFLYGYIFASNQCLAKSTERYKYLFLFVALGGTAAVIACGNIGRRIAYPDYSMGSVFFGAAWGLIAFSMMVFFLGIGREHLNKEHKYLSKLNEMVMPFYMLHYSIMLLVGYKVLAWKSSIAMKFWVIGVVTLLTTGGVGYLLMVKLSWLRLFFGMKPDRRSSSHG